MPVSPTASAHDADIAVVGAGAAGLYAALCGARQGARVVLISATPLAQTASYWAQGGLAAALAADDSFELHLRDTEAAGASWCAARRPRSGPPRRPPACATSRGMASASTRTVSGTWPSASREAIPCGASFTPGQRDGPTRRPPALRAGGLRAAYLDPRGIPGPGAVALGGQLPRADLHGGPVIACRR